jgi:signal transduction histidine kinase
VSDPDDARVRRSALRIGILVGGASAVILAAGVAALIGVLVATSRPEGRHEEGPGHHPGDVDEIVVDLDRILPWVIGLGIVGVLLMALVAWFFARRAVDPLAAALRAQRHFVSDASHELRTPLTALSSRIQILQRRHARGEPIETTIADLRRDADTLDEVLTDMLISAEGATADGEADADDAVSAAFDAVRPVADEAGVALRSEATSTVTVAMPAVTFTRLCVALIDNAVQHAPAGTAVTVRVDRVGGRAEVRVSDRGSGIAPADAERIFDRFARGGESGRRRGFGLGLALVRETAARFGGSVGIEKTSPDGTTFLLALPAR